VELKFSQIARAKVAKGEELISLGLGKLYFKTPEEIINATIQALHDGYTRYLNGAGLIQLRERIQQKINYRHL
jgi:aspartate aminotransferase